MLTSLSLFCNAQEEVMSTSYVCRDMKGAERWHADVEVKRKEGDVYVLTEKGEGIYSSFDGPISWVAHMEYESTDETVRPLSLEKRVYDEKGKMIRLEEQSFDLVNNIATCTHKDFPRNISRTKRFKFTKDIVNRLLLAPYAQKLLERGKRSRIVQMVSEEPKLYTMEIRVVDEETININGRFRRAYKFCIDPQLGFLNFVKVFFPKAYAWHLAKPDFKWLRYEGLEGDIKSEKVEVTTEDRL